MEQVLNGLESEVSPMLYRKPMTPMLRDEFLEIVKGTSLYTPALVTPSIIDGSMYETNAGRWTLILTDLAFTDRIVCRFYRKFNRVNLYYLTQNLLVLGFCGQLHDWRSDEIWAFFNEQWVDNVATAIARGENLGSIHMPSSHEWRVFNFHTYQVYAQSRFIFN